MKVLFLTVNLAGGGAEKVLVNLVNQLASRGHDVTLRSLTNVGVNKEFLNNKVKYEYIFNKKIPLLGKLYLLPKSTTYKLLVPEDYDIVIPYLQGVLTRIVANAPGEQKKIAWLHGDMAKNLSLFNVDELSEIWGKYNHIVAVSEVVKESFEKISGIVGRTTVLYNTFDVETIHKLSKERVDLFKNVPGIKICSVGKLEHIKGYGRLISAVKRINEERIRCSLCIVGEGNQREELTKYIEDNGMGSYVKLVGFDRNPYKYISNSDLFVCSSYTEGFSSVVAESLIIGTPVLTTDCSGMKEMLGDSEYGIISENSEEGIYRELNNIVSNKKILEDLAAKANIRSKFFSTEKTVTAVENYFEMVMND